MIFPDYTIRRLYNTESTTDADPPIAEESAKAFSLPEGIKVKVWASEPMVQNPIGMAWDNQGRMWIAENYTYGSRKIRFDLSLRDRVIILLDTDGDGQADTRKVFTDKVQMLTSVEVGQGGVWLMCPPKLLFIPDRNGDLIPDGKPEVMLDGFDVAREIIIILPMVYVGVPMVGFMADVDTPAPEELECRVRPMNYVIRLTGGSGVIIRKERWLRYLLMERLIHGGMTGMSTGNCFLLIP